MSDSSSYDVAVVGAGAAGLMAAISAAEAGARVLLLEKTARPGVKILMSGGTRCNITHATDNKGIVAAYGPPGRFLHSALAAFSVQNAIDFFEGEGVTTKVEDTGKIFPVSNKAADVLAALLARLRRTSADLTLETPLLQLDRCEVGFALVTPRRTYTAGRVILTTGGKSYPGSGTTGDGYALTQAFGHAIVPPRPALVPITVDMPWVSELRGITLPDISARVVQGDQVLMARRGSLLFAHFGLTGPVILDISRVVSGHPAPRSLRVELDLSPDETQPHLDERIRVETAAEGKKLLAAVLSAWMPRRLAEGVLAAAELPPDRRAAALSRPERTRLVEACKRLRLPISGTLGFGRAEVTAGGVTLDEVDSRSMQSKLVPGLFIAGELLDLDGPIGGYNFQAAWSTGWLAGMKAATG